MLIKRWYHLYYMLEDKSEFDKNRRIFLQIIFNIAFFKSFVFIKQYSSRIITFKFKFILIIKKVNIPQLKIMNCNMNERDTFQTLLN